MPQSGDGGLWPTSDDDKRGKKPSRPVTDASTHKMPVPGRSQEPPAGGWFDPPAAEEPAQGSDKQHVKPAQQRTQPVSWPVAELARQAEQAGVEQPTWPGEDRSKVTQSGKPAANHDWFASQDAESATRAWPTDSATVGLPRPPSSGPAQEESSSTGPRREAEGTGKPAAQESREDGWPAAGAATESAAVAEPGSAEGDHWVQGKAHSPEPDRSADEGTTPEGSPAGATDPGAAGEQPATASAPEKSPEVGRSEVDASQPQPKGTQPQPKGTQPQPKATEVAHAESEAAESDRRAGGSGQGVSSGSGRSAVEAAHPESQVAEAGSPAAGSTQGKSPEGGRSVVEGADRESKTVEVVRPALGSAQENSPGSSRSGVDGTASEGAEASRRAAGSDQGTSSEGAGPAAGGTGGEGGRSAAPTPAQGEDAEPSRPAAGSVQGTSSEGAGPAAGGTGGEGGRSAAAATPSQGEAVESGRPTAASPDPQPRTPGDDRGQAEGSDRQAERRSAEDDRSAAGSTRLVWEPAVGGRQATTPPDPQRRTADDADPGAAEGRPPQQETGGLPRRKPGRPTAGPSQWPAAGRETRTPATGDPTRAQQKSPATDPTEARRAEPARGTADSDRTAINFRPVQPDTSDRDRTVVNFRPVQPEDAASLLRPSKPDAPKPGTPGAHDPSAPSSMDSATVHLPRPVQPRQDNPPAFVRPQPRTDGTTNRQRPERKDEWPPPEPPRAAPQRVGPPPAEPPAPTTKKKKPLLIAAVAIVAVIAVAAGVIFGIPGVAQKLGLGNEDPVAVDPPPAPISYTPGLRGPEANAPTPTKDGVARVLAGPMSNAALGTVTGVVIDPATGEALYERDSGTAITPASTGKILTAATALLSLDHTEQLVTKVVQGDQPGEVIIVGGGDPTISSLRQGDESIYPGAAHLSELVDQVRASGATVQTVYVDQSRYDGPKLAPSWLPADVGAGYIAPIVPAMLDGDRQDPTENYSPRSNDPGRTLATEFASRIGAAAASSTEKKAPADAKVLGEIRSAPITQLVDNMLDRSENTLGDILAHEVAIKTGEEPSFAGASKAMLDVLRQNDFDVDGVVLRDGSGMSTENKVPAELLAQILAVAAGPDGKDPRTVKLRPLLGGLPVAGGSGTLADRYDDGATTGARGWLRAKTGSLTGVNSLAGIVLDEDNRLLVFAFLTNDSEASTARPALDAVSAALRGCGCQ